MAAHLLRRYSTLDYPLNALRPKLDGPRLRKLQMFVEEHLHDDLSVARLAEQVGMGSWAFSRAFKEATVSPAHQYIVGARVKRARLTCRRGYAVAGYRRALRFFRPGPHDALGQGGFRSDTSA